MKPFPYQREAIDSWFAGLESGHRWQVIVLPTGCGKTFTAATLAMELRARLPDPSEFRMLFLAHRGELLDQATEEFWGVWPEMRPTRIQSSSSAFGTRRSRYDAYFAMIDTARQSARLQRLLPIPWDLIVVDEAHHSPAPTYKNVLQQLASRSGSPGLGLTATPNRPDGIGLHEVWDRFAYTYLLADAIQDGWLTPFRTVVRELKVDLDQIAKGKDGDFEEASLAKLMEDPHVLDLTIDAWEAEAADRRRTIFFCVRVSHARRLAERFCERGVAADYVDGETPYEDRRARYAALREGRIRVLCNVMVATEGFNVKPIDCVALARPTVATVVNVSLLAQMIGRGLRVSPGKTDCLVLDCTGRTLHSTLVYAPMLGGLPQTPTSEGPEVRAEVDKLVKTSEDALGVRRDWGSVLAALSAARSIDLLRKPCGREFEWTDTPWGVALSLGRREAGFFLVRAHLPRDGARAAGRYKVAHLMPIGPDQQRVEVVADHLWPEEAIGLAEGEAVRFRPSRARRGEGPAPADLDQVAAALNQVVRLERDLNDGRRTAMVGASLPATAEAVAELRRRGVRLSDEMASKLTRAEADSMLRQGRAAGWRRVRIPARLKA